MRVAVIPARGGSRRIPRKNLKPFAGKPIIAHSIGTALASGCFDRVVVSTDDEEIADVAAQYCAEVPFLRPPALADDHAGTTEVVQHAVRTLAEAGAEPTYVCCIYATAPLLTPETLQEGFEKLTSSGRSYAFGVAAFPSPIQRALRIRPDGALEPIWPENVFVRSQDLEPAYHDAGQFYWGTARAWLAGEQVHSSRSVPVVLPAHRVQDIDTPEDWVRAERLYELLAPAESSRAPLGQPGGPTLRALCNVMVSSASRKVPLLTSVKEAAARISPLIRVYAGDVDPDVDAQFVADGFVEMPHTTDENAGRILDLLLERRIGTVIPTRDGELPFWAEHREWFESHGVKVVVSDPAAIRTTLDKLAFSRFGAERGLPVVPVLDEPVGDGPFVVKERFGAGSASIGTGLDQEQAVAHAARLAEPLVQPMVTGSESSVDAWFSHDGTLKGMVLRRRDRVVDGESQVTTTFRDDALEADVRRVLEPLRLRGPVVAQVIRDAEGRTHVIEVNARFGGATTTAIEAGLDIWYWTLLEAEGQSVDGLAFRRIPGEVRQIRVPRDLYVRVPS